MPRIAEKPVINDFVKELMVEKDCWENDRPNYIKMERITHISESNWRSWGSKRTSPLLALEIVDQLMKSTGKSVDELLQGFRAQK